MAKVLVLGGGFCGAHVAKYLQHAHDVTLIDMKDYFEFTPSVLRVLIHPRHRIQVSHKSYLPRATILIDSVTGITPSHVMTAKGTRVPYDYLAICLGSRYQAPFKGGTVHLASRAKTLRDLSHKLDDAKHVLIIGGGLVGVELAAEIATARPEKKVTIVHAHDRLMERMPQRASAYATRFLQERGVTILFSERIITHKKETFVTENGTRVKSDLAFLCTGITPNTEPFRDGLKDVITSDRKIRVNTKLQVGTHTNIFAGGDITNIPEEKSAQNAELHARIIAQNIIAHHFGTPMQTYTPGKRAMVISLGPTQGILTYGNRVLVGVVPGLLKKAVEWKEMMRLRL